MLAVLFNSLPVTLLIEGGVFLALAVAVRFGRKVIK